MKKWRKFSLASLVIPTVGSMALVAVGCGDNGSSKSSDADAGALNTPVETPVLVANPTVTTEYRTAQDWWDAFNQDQAAEVKAFNALTNNSNKLDAKLVKTIEFNLDKTDSNKFTITISLTAGYMFDKTKETTWTSDPITYVRQMHEVNVPEFADASPVVYDPNESDHDAYQWWTNTFGGSIEQEIGYLNINIFKSTTTLDAKTVQSVIPNFDESRQKPFTITVKLNDGYIFKGTNSDTWTSSKEISYMREVVTPVNLSTVGGMDADASAYLATLDAEGKSALANALFTTLPSDNQINEITHSTPVDNTFKVTVTLNPGFVFPNTHKDTWESGTITYKKAVNPLSDPQIKVANKTIKQGEKTVEAWFNGLNAEGKFNAFFNTYDKYSDIKSVTIQAFGNHFSVRVEAKEGSYFSSTRSTTFVSSNWVYVRTITLPELNGNGVKSTESSINAWWNTFQDSVYDQAAALNKLIKQTIEWQVIKSIDINANDTNHTFTLKITLRDGNEFTDGQIVATTGSINYVQQFNVPTLINTPRVVSKEGSAEEWWKTLADNTAKVNALNKLLTVNQKIDVNTVQDITLIPVVGDFHHFTVKVTLKSGYTFGDGSTSWTTLSAIEYCTQLPDLQYAKNPWIIGTQDSVDEWWASIKDSLPYQIAAVNGILTGTVALDGNKVESIEFNRREIHMPHHLSKTVLELKVNLKPGYAFANGNVYDLVTDFAYKTGILAPVFTSMTPSVISKQETAAEWLNSLGSVANQVTEINKLLTQETQLDPKKISNISVDSDNNRYFTLKIEAFSNYVFSGQKPSSTFVTSSIYYQTQVISPKLDVVRTQISLSQTISGIDDWWNLLGSLKEKVDKINTFLSADTKLNLVDVERVNIVKKDNATFQFVINLKIGCVFSSDNKTTEVTTDSIKVTYLLPSETVSPKTFYGSYSVGDEWWKWVFQNDLKKEVELINTLLSSPLKLEWIDSVKPMFFASTTRETTLNFTVTTRNGYLFHDNTKKLFCPDNVYVNQIPTPVLSGKFIHSIKNSPKEWWGSLQDKDAKVAAINQILTYETRLDPSLVKDINSIISSEADFIFGVGVTLTSGSSFPSNSPTWESGIKIVYKIDTGFTINNSNVKTLVYDEPTSLGNLRSTYGDIGVLNLYSQNHFDNNWVSKVDFKTLSDDGVVTTFTMSVQLKDLYCFNDGSQTWTSPTLTYHRMRDVKVPVLYNPKDSDYSQHRFGIRGAGTASDGAVKWWNKHSLEQQIQLFNNNLVRYYPLSLDSVASIEIHGQGGLYHDYSAGIWYWEVWFTIHLKPGWQKEGTGRFPETTISTAYSIRMYNYGN